MKKLLLLLSVLLTGVSGAWATIDIKYVASEVKKSAQGGINPATYYKTDGTTSTETAWYAKNVTNSAIPITLDFGAVNGVSNYSGGINVYGSKTLTISLPSDYKIVSYTISGTPSGNCSLTPAGGSTSEWSKASLGSLTVNSVNNYTTTIAFSGEDDGNGWSECIIADLKIIFTVDDGDAVTPVIENGLYKVTYAKGGSATCYMTSDFKYVNERNRTNQATASLSCAGLMFTRVPGTNDTYYIQSPKNDSYLYANGRGSIGTSPNYQYRNYSALTAKPLNSTIDDDFKWKIVKDGTKYNIRPYNNDNAAIAVFSDQDLYFSFYSTTYDFAEAELTSVTIEQTINAYRNEISPAMSRSGVGCPDPEATTSTTFLDTYKDVFVNNNKTDESFKKLYSDFWAFINDGTIVMPEDGKIYTFTNVQVKNPRYYLNSSGGIMSEGTDEASATKYICHKLSTNQFAFISIDDWYWMIAAHGKKINNEYPGKTASQTYDGTCEPITISSFYSNRNSYTTYATPENTFGLVQIIGVRKGETNQNSVGIMTNGGKFDVSGGAYFTTDYSSAYQIKEVTDYSYYNKINMATDGTNAYASTYLPIPVIIPEGVTAYAVESQNGKYAHMESIVTNGILHAETPAILKKAGQNENETIYLSPATDTGSEYTSGNLLGGTADDKTRGSLGTGTTYVLANGAEGLGLYEYTGENLAKGKAYLFVAGTSVKALTFDFGDAVGVNAIDNGQLTMDNDKVIFNLAGQRMSRAQKGVNIINGKKVLVK